VPKGTPRPVIAALESAIRAITESPEFIQGSERLYIRPAFLPAAEFGELIAREDAQLASIIQLLGLKK
jgi:tripartite-type tricarboxylate transporter receptor subunit TctC